MIVAFTKFVANASPISSIGIEALMPVFTVTVMLIGALDEPAVRVAPTGNAIRVTVFKGGAAPIHVAASGAVVSAELV